MFAKRLGKSKRKESHAKHAARLRRRALTGTGGTWHVATDQSALRAAQKAAAQEEAQQRLQHKVLTWVPQPLNPKSLSPKQCSPTPSQGPCVSPFRAANAQGRMVMWHEVGAVACVECKGQQYALKASPNRYPKPYTHTLHLHPTP